MVATTTPRVRSAGLSKSEKAKLTQLEDVIQTAQRWQAEAARALVEVRDRKLYRDGFKTFELYGQTRWGYEKSYLYALCQWGQTLTHLSTIAETLPLRESHARPLYALSPEDQKRAWKAVLRTTDTPTARDVERAARPFHAPITREHVGALAYYGSKAALASQIIAELPPHRCYVETHGGGAAVLLAKPPSVVEVLNDLDDALVNFYQVLRDQPQELVRRLKRTPYAKAEWDRCRALVDEPQADAIERARLYYVTQCQSYSGTGTSFSRSNRKPQAVYFAARVDRMEGVAERLRRVVVESLDAVDLFGRYDDEHTVFYVDPPYLPETRTGRGQRLSGKYRFEMTHDQHVELLEALQRVRAKVLLSGYDSGLYTKALRSWRVCWRHRVPCTSGNTLNQRNAHHRVEVLWANW